MLWTISVILLILWLLGFSFHVGGALIHIILVIVWIAVVIKLVVRSTGVGVRMHMETLEQSLLKLPIQETLLGNARTNRSVL